MTRTWNLRKGGGGGGIQVTEQVAPLAAVDASGAGLSLEGARGDWLILISEGCGKTASENMEPICSLKPAAELA